MERSYEQEYITSQQAVREYADEVRELEKRLREKEKIIRILIEEAEEGEQNEVDNEKDN